MNNFGGQGEVLLQRDPGTAALLSIIPGLGQIYNGQTRKGILFLDVAIVNVVLLFIMTKLHVASAATLMLCGLTISFIAYAVRDAYDHAFVKRRRALYADSVIELPEATSGSYLFHIAIISAAIVMTVLFVIPPKNPIQITEIEFITQEPEIIRPPVKPKFQSNKNATAQGKHNPLKPVTTQQASAPAQKPSPMQPVTNKVPTPPAPVQQQPQSHSQPQPQPQPTHAPSQAPPAPVPVPVAIAQVPTFSAPKPTVSPTRSAPMPTITPTAPSRTFTAAVPVPVALNIPTAPNSIPMPVTSGAFKSAANLAPAPAPVQLSSKGSSSASMPVPITSSGTSGSSAAKGTSTGPAPTRIASSHSGSSPNNPGAMATPSLGSPGSQGNHGSTANPAENGLPGNAQTPTGEANFGPYMNDLQRRIKRAWFPPKGDSRRVVVTFKIFSDGTVSGIHITQSSGVALCDTAAMLAVQNAAPFPHLPPLAPSDVDIQFTFDYNVMNGGSASYRRF